MELQDDKKIYFTSDLHFNHDREFVWKPRGFNSVNEMNDAIISNWNNMITDDDIVYVLGDLMLGGPDKMEDGLDLLRQLKGKIHVIIGNHDTDNRIDKYFEVDNIKSVNFGGRLKYRGRSFFLSHYPTEVSNLEASPYECVINLHGHTHSKSKFYDGKPYMYNVALDAHDNKPVLIDDILDDFYNEVKSCKEQL